MNYSRKSVPTCVYPVECMGIGLASSYPALCIVATFISSYNCGKKVTFIIKFGFFIR